MRDERSSAVSGVFEALFLDLGGAFPDDLAGAGVGETEAVEDVIAGALRGLGGQALEFAGEEIISAAEFDDGRIGASGDLAVALVVGWV